MSQVANRIKKVRSLLKISQALFAAALGVSRAHISKIETGAATPSDQLIKLIARTWLIREEWLREGTGELDATGKTMSKEEAEEAYRDINIFRAEAAVASLMTPLKHTARSVQWHLDLTRNHLKGHKKYVKEWEIQPLPADHPLMVELEASKKELDGLFVKFKRLMSSIPPD
jgi:transcriptional regulator with XRE-family HTH domain